MLAGRHGIAQTLRLRRQGARGQNTRNGERAHGDSPSPSACRSRKCWQSSAAISRSPDATVVLDRAHYMDIIGGMAPSELIMIGKSTAHRLELLGIRTIRALAAADRGMLREHFGVVADKMSDAARGYRERGSAAVLRQAHSEKREPRHHHSARHHLGGGFQDRGVRSRGACRHAPAPLRTLGGRHRSFRARSDHSAPQISAVHPAVGDVRRLRNRGARHRAAPQDTRIPTAAPRGDRRRDAAHGRKHDAAFAVRRRK